MKEKRETIFTGKTCFKTFKPNFRKMAFLLTTSALLAVESYVACQMKLIGVFHKKSHFRKKSLKILDQIFSCFNFCLLLRY